MKYAVIRNGAVFTFAEASPQFAASQGWIQAPDDTQVGDLYDGATFTAPPDRAAQLAEQARLAEIDSVIGPDRELWKGMTNAQIDTWFAANVTDLASARAVLKRIARIVIRRLL